jgi:prepilin signal peptidase PulO-like enzyme (type II secretory pathway)
METRLRFLLGDLFANASLGALTALACFGLVSETWNPLLAMLAGMVLGMILAFFASVVFGIYFGAFEIMLPIMLTGMVSGMAVAMLAAMAPLPAAEAIQWGAAVGIATLALTYVANAFLQGEVSRWTA